MRTETIVKTYLKFDELNDEQKEQVIENNFAYDAWHYEHCMQERIDTLKALAKRINGRLDYCISCVPDRGEFIKIDHDNEDDLKEYLRELIEDKKDCPLTGVCYDEDIRESLDKNNLSMEALQGVLDGYLESIHREYESMLSVEYIGELCEENEYEFDLDTLKLA